MNSEEKKDHSLQVTTNTSLSSGVSKTTTKAARSKVEEKKKKNKYESTKKKEKNRDRDDDEGKKSSIKAKDMKKLLKRFDRQERRIKDLKRTLDKSTRRIRSLDQRVTSIEEIEGIDDSENTDDVDFIASDEPSDATTLDESCTYTTEDEDEDEVEDDEEEEAGNKRKRRRSETIQPQEKKLFIDMTKSGAIEDNPILLLDDGINNTKEISLS